MDISLEISDTMHFLFLRSLDASQNHPDNTPEDLTVTLPKPYYLRGEWECALLEITLPTSQDRVRYACSDLLEDSYLRDTTFPVFRTLKPGRKGHFRYHRPYVLPVRARELTQIRIFIRGSESDTLCVITETETMGSIEIYDVHGKTWLPYVPDFKKWEQHIVHLSEGRGRPDHKGRYMVGSGSQVKTVRADDTPKVTLVTPVAQAVEMARSAGLQSSLLRRL